MYMLELLECISEKEQENNNNKLFFNNKYLESEFKNLFFAPFSQKDINKNSIIKKIITDTFKSMTKKNQTSIELNLDLETMLLYFSKYKFGFNCNEMKIIMSDNNSYSSVH